MNNLNIKVAMTSLRQALKSYYSTSRCDENLSSTNIKKHVKYEEAYFNAIIYSQHFFELVFKEILVSVPCNKKTNNSKNKKGGKRKNKNIYKWGFGDVLDEIKKNGILSAQYYQYVDDLRKERNKLWHSGSCTNDISFLDELVGRKTLEVVKYVFQQYYNYNYNSDIFLECIDDLLRETSTINKNWKKIFILKEFAYAKINSPVYRRLTIPNMQSRIVTGGVEQFLLQIEKQELQALADAYEGMASSLQKNDSGDYTVEENKCPICECKSIINYIEKDSDYVGEQDEPIGWWWEEKKACLSCGFTIPKQVGNPKESGFNDIDWAFMES